MKEWKMPELLVLDVEYTEFKHHGNAADGGFCEEDGGEGHALIS